MNRRDSEAAFNAFKTAVEVAIAEGKDVPIDVAKDGMYALACTLDREWELLATLDKTSSRS